MRKLHLKIIVLLYFYSSIAYGIECGSHILGEPFSLPDSLIDYFKFCPKELENSLIKNDIEEQEAAVNTIMAQKIFTRINQSLNDIASIERFYSKNGVDIGRQDSDLLNSCSLKKISEIEQECQNIPNANTKKKVQLIITAFSAEKTEGKNLSQIAAKRFAEIRSILNRNKSNHCPFPEHSSHEIISRSISSNLKKDFFSHAKKNEKLDNTSDPLQKILFASKNYSDLIKQNANSSDPNEFYNQVFKSGDFKKILSNSLVSKCNSTFSKLKDFLCTETGLFSKSAIQNKSLALKNENDKDINIINSCRYKRLIKHFSENKDSQKKIFYDKLNKDISESLPLSSSKEDNKNTSSTSCEIYFCKNKEFKCSKNNTIITSSELQAICDTRKESCSIDVLGMIPILEQYEKDNENSPSQSSSSTASSSGKERHSVFLANFLGAEGIAEIEGKPATPANIQAIESRIASRVAEATSPTATSSTSMVIGSGASSIPNSTDVTTNETTHVASNTTSAPKSPPVQMPTANSNSDTSFNNARSSFIPSAPKNDISDTDAAALRKQLDQMVQNIGKNPAENFETVAAYNKEILDNKKGLNVTDQNKAERERLDRYRDRLEKWEGDIRDEDTGNFRRRSQRAFDEDEQYADSDMSPTSRNLAGGPVNGSGPSKAGSSSSLPTLTATKNVKGAAGANSQANGNGQELTGETSLEISPEELVKLNPEQLAKLGIKDTSSFFLKVKSSEGLVLLPVKKLKYDNQEVLTPIMSEKSKVISDFVSRSPLFAPYRDMQAKATSTARLTYTQLQEAFKRK